MWPFRRKRQKPAARRGAKCVACGVWAVHRKFVSSGATVSAHIDTCERCGITCTQLTGAGVQQVGWWLQLGATRGEAVAHALAGEYPWAIFEKREAASDEA